ncbi:TRAP transporter large permease subunit [Chloroflexota bacterium]
MEWWLILIIIFGSLFILMLSGMPVAFAFMLINIAGVFILWGGEIGLHQLTLSINASVTSFIFVPVVMFILMGEVVFQAGIFNTMVDTLEKWLGRLPGRLGLLSVASGTLFATLTGNSMASIAVLGGLLVPEMEKRGYKKSMSLGPIMGSGGLAWMIPPSDLGVLLGAIARISIGGILMAIIIPGLILAAFYAAYIIIRCWLQPSIAPSYRVPPTPLTEKLVATVKNVLPVGFIVFLVVGLILLGIATPSEAAGAGAAGCFVLAAAYRRLSWRMIKESVMGTASVSVMIFMIIVGASAFSQILASSGASRGVVGLALGLSETPILVMIAMQLVLVFLGMFMEIVSMMMVTMPLFMPVVNALGFDTVWFAVIVLINFELATLTPPLGLDLFVMKGVAPPDTTMGDCYRAIIPFLIMDAVVIAVVMAFPGIALWLPSLVR